MNAEAVGVAFVFGLLGLVSPLVEWPVLIMLYPICFVVGFAVGRWARRNP